MAGAEDSIWGEDRLISPTQDNSDTVDTAVIPAGLISREEHEVPPDLTKSAEILGNSVANTNLGLGILPDVATEAIHTLVTNMDPAALTSEEVDARIKIGSGLILSAGYEVDVRPRTADRG